MDMVGADSLLYPRWRKNYANAARRRLSAACRVLGLLSCRSNKLGVRQISSTMTSFDDNELEHSAGCRAISRSQFLIALAGPVALKIIHNGYQPWRTHFRHLDHLATQQIPTFR